MFTGIVEDIGVIERITPGAESLRLHVRSEKALEDAAIGDSIAINGVCLTVSEMTEHSFAADVIPETMKATTLGELSVGSSVNVERAMQANDRFGGHFVTGHVDTVGTIVRTTRRDNARYVEIETSKEFQPYYITKGSVAVDGTSLTVFGVTDSGFIISLIPTTEKDTILGDKDVGDTVNVECDMFAKYIDRLLDAREKETSGVTMEMLVENGFA